MMRNYAIAAFGILLLMLCSCGTQHREYTDYVDDKTSVVTSINLNEILGNAGFVADSDGSLSMPRGLKSLLPPGAYQRLAVLIDPKAVDLGRVILTVGDDNTAGGAPVLMAQLFDPSAFVDNLKREFSAQRVLSKGGIDYYTFVGVIVAVDGDMAIISDLGADSMKTLVDRMRENAAALPLASWKRERLAAVHTTTSIVALSAIRDLVSSFPALHAHLTGSTDVSALDEGSLVVTSQLSGLSLTVRCGMVDGAGADVTTGQEQAPDFDRDMLRYIAPQDLMAALVALPDDVIWHQMVTEQLKSYFPNFDVRLAALYEHLRGTVVASFGYNSLVDLGRNRFHALLACGVEEGKGPEVISAWRDALGAAGLPVSGAYPSIRMSVEGLDVSISVADGNLVVSTGTPSDSASPLLSAADFGEYMGEAVLRIPSRSPAKTAISLPFGITAQLYAADSQLVLQVNMTDTQGLLLENMLSLLGAI